MNHEAKQRQTMIRSLVAEFDEEKQATLLRRNLSRENLERAIASNAKLWIDVVDPTTDEIDWLADHFHLGPAVVEDLMRADRRPTLLVVGCGDVGLRVLRLLRGRWRLLALTSSPSRMAELRSAGAVPLLGNLDDSASLHRLAALADHVLHLAPPPEASRTAVWQMTLQTDHRQWLQHREEH